MKLAEDLRRAVLQAAIKGNLTGGRCEGWRWVRLGDVVNVVSARRVHQSDWQKSGIPFYRAREIARLSENGYVDNELYISEVLFEKYSHSGMPLEGDIMITAVGTLGKTYIVRKGDKFYYKDASVLCLKKSDAVDSKYLDYVIKSELFMNQVRKNSSGTTVATLTIIRMNEYIIPLPSLDEQHRIVSRLDAILPLIAELEAAENELEDLKRKFPGDMRDSLLQAAIQGKLTGGNQEGWRWVRLGELGSYKKGPFGSSLTKDIFIPDGDMSVKVYEQKNAIKKDWKLGEYFITQEYYERSMKSFTVSPGDIIVSCAGTIGETYILPADSRIGIINQALMRISLIEAVDKDFYLFCFNHIIKNMAQRKSQGTAIKNIPPLSVLRNMIIPLPPLEEQKQIVSRLNELLPLCEALEKIN